MAPDALGFFGLRSRMGQMGSFHRSIGGYIHEESVEQVLIFGAGFDTRGIRFSGISPGRKSLFILEGLTM